MKKSGLITKMELIKRLNFFIVCLSFVSVFSIEAEEAYPPAVMTAGEAVYQISMPGSKGTGFFITPKLFVTNFHVIESIQDISTISFYSDREFSFFTVKKLVAVSYPYDLALLEIRGESAAYLSAGPKPQLEDTVFTAGYPAGDGDELKYHHSISDIKNWNDFFYTAHFNFGKGDGVSGSPVLNSQGQFFGIIFGSNDSEKSIVNSDWLKFADENTRTICNQHQALECIQKEVSRAKNLMQQFLAGQLVERESLGIIHTLKEYAEEDYLLKMAKDFNDGGAQFLLGILHLNQGDFGQAIYWLTLSAEGGNRMAQYNVGVFYNNQGDLEQAIYWLTLSAEGGVPLAQFSLGIVHHKQGNLEKAAYWYALAVEHGMRDAKINLGVLHYHQGDLEQAIYWLTLSAEDGSYIAQFNVGLLYEKQDQLEQAAYWYHLAAEQGVSDACYHLSEMYRYGKGVEQSDELADYWMAKVHEIEGS